MSNGSNFIIHIKYLLAVALEFLFVSSYLRFVDDMQMSYNRIYTSTSDGLYTENMVMLLR